MADREFEDLVARVRTDLSHAIERNPTAMQNSGVTICALAELALNIGLKSYGRQQTVDLFRAVIRHVPQLK